MEAYYSKLVPLAKEGQKEAFMEELNGLGIPIDFQDEEGRSLLHGAAEKGHHDMVTLLVEAGANVNVQDAYLRSPLHILIELGHATTACYLANHPKVDVNLQDRFGRTALHWSCQARDVSTSRALLDRGANPQARTSGDDTPLLWAVMAPPPDKKVVNAMDPSLKLELVRLLLSRGADPSFKNAVGQSCLELVRKEADQGQAGAGDLMKALEEAGTGSSPSGYVINETPSSSSSLVNTTQHISRRPIATTGMKSAQPAKKQLKIKLRTATTDNASSTPQAPPAKQGE